MLLGHVSILLTLNDPGSVSKAAIFSDIVKVKVASVYISGDLHQFSIAKTVTGRSRDHTRAKCAQVIIEVHRCISCGKRWLTYLKPASLIFLAYSFPISPMPIRPTDGLSMIEDGQTHKCLHPNAASNDRRECSCKV